MITSDEALFLLETLQFQLVEILGSLCSFVPTSVGPTHACTSSKYRSRREGMLEGKQGGIPIPLKEEDREICPEVNC